MEHLVQRYSPVSGSLVVAAVEGRDSLPRHAVWITFDDGYPDVLEHAEPVLAEFRIPATLFVVAGLVDTEDPFWWTVIECAEAEGLTDTACLGRLKRCPDVERREVVADLARRLAESQGRDLRVRQLTSGQLRRWLAAGHEVGNQSWDHPCLNRSTLNEQVMQVRTAHEWLTALQGYEPRLFAYPNGNWTPTVEAELRALNYAVALLFDHHLATPLNDPFRMSRVRIDSTANLRRFGAIVSGGHPGAYTAAVVARERLRRTASRLHLSSGVKP
jgi:peptidoglycan/xylan/chitin deacetylase (PgdA/CDA1 family)